MSESLALAMETKFQTSFIPKKSLSAPVVAHHGASVSIFMILSVIMFLGSIGYAGFSYWWNIHLVEEQKSLEEGLKNRRNRFNPTVIENLKNANTKIDLAKDLLKKHLAVEAVFDIIAKLTIESVRFNSLDLSVPQNLKDGIKITMRGVANDFKSIAFQSDVLGKSSKYGSNKVLRNPVLSDLSVDASGRVGFTFTAVVNSDDLLYTKVLNETLQRESEQSSGTSETTI